MQLLGFLSPLWVSMNMALVMSIPRPAYFPHEFLPHLGREPLGRGVRSKYLHRISDTTLLHASNCWGVSILYLICQEVKVIAKTYFSIHLSSYPTWTAWNRLLLLFFLTPSRVFETLVSGFKIQDRKNRFLFLKYNWDEVNYFLFLISQFFIQSSSQTDADVIAPHIWQAPLASYFTVFWERGISTRFISMRGKTARKKHSDM